MEAAATCTIKAFANSTSRNAISLPVDIREILKINGIEVNEAGNLDSTVGARLVPFGTRFKISVRRDLTRANERFALAHELGHKLFYQTIKVSQGFLSLSSCSFCRMERYWGYKFFPRATKY